MHSRLYNEATLRLTITPIGPLLVKSGEETFDPRLPNMSFVRTFSGNRRTVYLPGSSLKGMLRSHSEKLGRTVDTSRGHQLACNPLRDDESCGGRIRREISKEREMKKEKAEDWPGSRKHAKSCFICRMFGSTSIASHFQISDAYPVGDYHTEERNSVAIDRVYGSVMSGIGPFNYETVTEGKFRTTLRLKNFTLAQLGLLSLALRDLSLERIRLGFAKSRGLGLVSARVEELTLNYPLCELADGQLRTLGASAPLAPDRLYGVGHFVGANEGYGYPSPDEVELPSGYAYEADDLMGVEVRAPVTEGAGADWKPLALRCVPKWKSEVEHAGRA